MQEEEHIQIKMIVKNNNKDKKYMIGLGLMILNRLYNHNYRNHKNNRKINLIHNTHNHNNQKDSQNKYSLKD